MKNQEPLPLWAEAPRYSPTFSFPAYRFVPGLNPHPRGQPQGHSYGKEEWQPTYQPPSEWRDNKTYLFGIDLYHQGYFWESHETWEALWHLTAKDDPEGQILQGLVQNAAALLKLHLQEWKGGRHLSQEAFRRLTFVAQSDVADNDGYYMGIHLAKFLQQMELYYGPLWKQQDEVGATPPRLELKR